MLGCDDVALMFLPTVSIPYVDPFFNLLLPGCCIGDQLWGRPRFKFATNPGQRASTNIAVSFRHI